MRNPDHVHRFLFEQSPIRGQHVSLDSSWRQIVEQSQVTGVGLTLLGHALSAAALLVETLKIDGSITLQVRGSGAIHLLVVEATSAHTVRGVLRQTREPGENSSLAEVFESDKLVITIRNGPGKPYQGIVPLVGNSIAEALQAYFAQSEQLPTHFYFDCDENCASGMLLQRLPGESLDDDAWNRVSLMASTLNPGELLRLPVEELLVRLFHQEKLRIFDPTPIAFFCSCSVDRSRNMLMSLGKAEVESMFEEQDEVIVTCEFCNRHYCFDRVDFAVMFDPVDTVPLSKTCH